MRKAAQCMHLAGPPASTAPWTVATERFRFRRAAIAEGKGGLFGLVLVPTSPLYVNRHDSVGYGRMAVAELNQNVQGPDACAVSRGGLPRTARA